MLEGHCFDMSTGQPPRGLQFTLGMSQDPLTYDTIVMANLVSSLLYLILELLKILSLKNKCESDAYSKDLHCLNHNRDISS